MSPKSHLALAVMLFSPVWLMACGKSSNKQVAVPDTNKEETGAGLEGEGAPAGTDCKEKKCDPANPDVSANFSPQGILIGFVGEPVVWDFYGVDRNTLSANQQSSARTIAVLLDKVPEGSTIDPEPQSGKVAQHTKINWTPDRELKGKLDIILRDYDRCLAKESESKCNKYAFLSEYDTKLPDIPWEIVDKEKVQDQVATGTGDPNQNVVTVGNPNCGPTPTTDADINGKLMGTLIQVIANPGGLGSLAPTLLQGAVSGAANGGSAANPTEC